MTDKKIIDEITIALASPVKYSKDGEFHECHEAQICSPTNKQYKKTYVLQQFLSKSVLEAEGFLKKVMEVQSDETEEKDEKEVDAKMLKMLLLSSDVDIEACLDRFEILAVGGCVKIMKNNLTKIQWGDMAPQDQETCMLEFMVNFILPSVMETLGA